MEIVENLAEWQQTFESGWLAHLAETGKTDFSLYPKMDNTLSPSGPAIKLSQSRLALISSAGAYLKDSQAPFDGPNPKGDYSIRRWPSTTPFSSLAYEHTHYDHTAVNTDPQVLLPLLHLAELVQEGVIGEIAPSVISFMGYQPDVPQVLNQTIPAILEAAKAEEIDAALLVPSWPICSQSVGLIARALELNGIATTLTSWNPGRTRPTAPPRATITQLNRGATIGRPHDTAQQRRILDATLALLAQAAPLEIVRLNESAES